MSSEDEFIVLLAYKKMIEAIKFSSDDISNAAIIKNIIHMFGSFIDSIMNTEF